MKKTLLFVTAFAVALTLGGTSLFAQHGGGGHGGGGGMGGSGMGGGNGMGGNGMGGGMSTHGNSAGHMGGSTGMRPSGSSLGKQSPNDILSKTPQLSTRLQSLLPSGTNLTDAAAGFKNLGQFVAAVHVSHNLGISFDDLKQKMISGNKLGKAIHELKPDANAKDEAKKAEKQSKQDLDEAASEPEAKS